MNDRLLQQLIDRQEISDVLVEYCCALDGMDLPRLSELFTKDCVVDYGPDERLRSNGSDALEISLERMWRWSRTSHHLSNVKIRFDGDDDAHVRSYVHAWHERADGSTATIFGQYHDIFVRENSRWRIAERRMVMNGSDAGFTVNINKFERMPPPDDWVAPDLDGKN
jgi:3-phenylpropionate/cinnamic acid dioxygenase small subunit